MPVRTHTGAEAVLRGPTGERYAVYVMGPSGIITIDPGVSFDVPEGYSAVAGEASVSLTITCTVPVVWNVTWSAPTYRTQSPGNGVTSRSMYLGVDAPRLSNGNQPSVTRTATISATYGSRTYSWTIQLTAEGAGSNGNA